MTDFKLNMTLTREQVYMLSNWVKEFDLQPITVEPYKERSDLLIDIFNNVGEIVPTTDSGIVNDDLRLLNFIHERMREVHGENPNVDYMYGLRRVINNLHQEPEQLTVDHIPQALWDMLPDDLRYVQVIKDTITRNITRVEMTSAPIPASAPQMNRVSRLHTRPTKYIDGAVYKLDGKRAAMYDAENDCFWCNGERTLGAPQVEPKLLWSPDNE